MSWHNPETIEEKLLNRFLIPFSGFYSLATQLIATASKSGFLKGEELPVPVISIGNLTVGGTGKTPVTIDLAQRLIKAGYKVAILSRGYKRKSKETVLVVSDGKKIFVDSEKSGDEPYLIASSVPQAIVIVGASRAESGRYAVSKHGANIILLDDGFQHLKVKRDINIVLLDYADDLDKLKLLPAGRLREPISALARANRVIITKVPQTPDQKRLASIEQTVRRYAPSIDITSCRFVCDSARETLTNRNIDIKGKRVYALCGIARPESFLQSIKELGADIVVSQSMPDHHWPSAVELNSIKIKFTASKAELLVITEKDRVRLPKEFLEQLPVAELKLSCQWLDDLPLACCMETESCTTSVKEMSL